MSNFENVMQKLNYVQLSIKAPKSQFNSFGKYAYRSCEDIINGAKKVLNEAGAVIVIDDKIVQVGERYYVEATATFICCDTMEEVKNTASAREPMEKKGMDASQITGATSSYARKYALNGLLLIDDSKDVDYLDGENSSTERKDINDDFFTTGTIEWIRSQKEAGVSMQGVVQLIRDRKYKVTEEAEKRIGGYYNA